MLYYKKKIKREREINNSNYIKCIFLKKKIKIKIKCFHLLFNE